MLRVGACIRLDDYMPAAGPELVLRSEPRAKLRMYSAAGRTMRLKRLCTILQGTAACQQCSQRDLLSVHRCPGRLVAEALLVEREVDFVPLGQRYYLQHGLGEQR